ncbi:MAG: ribonuclease HI family protein [Minisyncoccales bacterium]
MKKVIIYTDGGSEGNPGKGAIAFIFVNEQGKIINEYSQEIEGKITNNEAEYLAAIISLKKFKQFFGKKLAKNTEIEIRSDSSLLVNQMKGVYKILEEKIKPLFLELWNLKIDFKKVEFKLIPREKNQRADSLVKKIFSQKNLF